jgi:hypothetical protein
MWEIFLQGHILITPEDALRASKTELAHTRDENLFEI